VTLGRNSSETAADSHGLAGQARLTFALVSKTRVCSACDAVFNGEPFLTTTGDTVCRFCFYEEQTAIQERRVKESKRVIAILDLPFLLKHLFVGGLLLLFGSAFLVGGIRGGYWSDVLWSVPILALGVGVLVSTWRAVREEQD